MLLAMVIFSFLRWKYSHFLYIIPTFIETLISVKFVVGKIYISPD